MHSIKDAETYFEVLARTMREVFFPGVDRIAEELLRAYRHGHTVYIFGNGGSAATASHFACDLSKGATKRLPEGSKRFRVIALTDNAAVMTAWANDAAYEDIFAEQLRNLIKADDVVLAISGSGNSPNVLKALAFALRSGAHTIGLTGFKGGKMKPLCRTCLVVPSDNMEVIEDVHMAVCHALATVIREALGQVRLETAICKAAATLEDYTDGAVRAEAFDSAFPQDTGEYQRMTAGPGPTGAD